ncbi:hypothetical protein [Roseibium aggregatum]|uniref:hypothetical protein n=1 Tax=Roseibium aggregatum TaxID=187304 RepID=UPI003A987DE3
MQNAVLAKVPYGEEGCAEQHDSDLTAVIIDDCRPDLSLQRFALQANGRFKEIVEFNSPVRALEAFATKSLAADLILVDFRMPWMTGPEFILAYERLAASYKPTPHIVLLSAMPGAELKAYEINSRLLLAVCPKPVSLDTIETIVGKIQPDQ